MHAYPSRVVGRLFVCSTVRPPCAEASECERAYHSGQAGESTYASRRKGGHHVPARRRAGMDVDGLRAIAGSAGELPCASIGISDIDPGFAEPHGDSPSERHG